MTNPSLVELTRGGLVESVHTGSIAVSRPNGEIILALGNTTQPVFPRSAIKALQCIPLLETGAADHYGFEAPDLALACASHSGTPEHAARAAAMLAKAGLTHEALGCGAHAPMHEASARAMAARQETPTALHNNCSGKHAGMVCACTHCGDPVAGYLGVEHPHQRRIARVLHDFCGDGFDARRFGIDGCSAPNWAIPVHHLAHAFAQLIAGEGAAKPRRAVTERIAKACMAAPDMVAGPERLDTLAMLAAPGRVFLKTGAEGVYCGALPDHGLGFALKIDDGNKRASEAVVAGLLSRLVLGIGSFGALGPTTNWRGTVTGETRLAGGLDSGLDRIGRKN